MAAMASAAGARAAWEHLPALFFLHYRRHWGDIERRAAEVGVETEALSRFFRSEQLLAPDGTVTEERLRWTSPYDARGSWLANWAACASAGLATAVPGGWRVTDRGRALMHEEEELWLARLAAARVPADPAARLVVTLPRVASRVPRDAERAALLRRQAAARPAPDAQLVRVMAAARELMAYRDDVHIAAWERAGYRGPTLDALSRVWSGPEGRLEIDELRRALSGTQSADDVEASVADLVARGDVRRDGDAVAVTPEGRRARDRIEAETDDVFFRGWPEGEELAELERDLRAMVSEPAPETG